MATEVAKRGLFVGVDGSPSAKVAVDWAAREAASRNLPLTLVHVSGPPVLMMWPEVPMPPEYAGWQEDQGRKILDAASNVAEQAAGDSGGLQILTEMPTGPTLATLVDLTRDAELVVVGCRGRGALARGLLGSVSSGLVRHAHCPVAVIHDEDPLMDKPAEAPVVVGIDGSPASELAVDIAFDAASRRGVELVAVHAVCDADITEVPGVDYKSLEEAAHEILGERLAGRQERYPDVKVNRVVTWALPANALVEQSEKAQLLVVGSHGRGAVCRTAARFGQFRSGAGGSHAGDRGPQGLTWRGESHPARPVRWPARAVVRRPPERMRRCPASTAWPHPPRCPAVRPGRAPSRGSGPPRSPRPSHRPRPHRFLGGTVIGENLCAPCDVTSRAPSPPRDTTTLRLRPVSIRDVRAAAICSSSVAVRARGNPAVLAHSA